MAFADTAKLAVRLDLDDNLSGPAKRASRSVDNLGDEAAQTDRQLKKMNKTAGGLRGKMGAVGGGILPGVGMGIGMAAVAGITQAGKALVNFGIDAVRAAAEEEAAISQLNAALVELNDGRQVGLDLVEESIAQRQTRLGFVDAEQRESLRLLLAYTKDYDEANRLMALGMDFARLRGIDLKTSVDLLGKAYTGNTSLLSRYGVVLEKGADREEAFAQIADMSRGQAEAWADTLEGKATRATQDWGDTVEDLGRLLQPVAEPILDLANDAIPALGQAVRDATPVVQDFVDEQGDLVDDLVGHWERGWKLIEDAVPGNDGGDVPWKDTILDRDYVNDAMNATRGVLSLGILPALDHLNPLMDDVSRGFHDMVGWVHDSEREVYALGGTTHSSAMAARNHAEALIAEQSAMKATGSAASDLTPEIEEQTAVQLTLADAVNAAGESYREQRKSVKDAIKDARETKEGRGGVNKQLNQLTREEERLVRKQAAAAEAGKVRKVAAWQAAIDKVREEKLELQNMLALFNQVRQGGPIDVTVRTNYVLGTVEEGAVVVSNRDIVYGNATVNNQNRAIGS